MAKKAAAVRLDFLDETRATLRALPEVTSGILGIYIRDAAQQIEQEAKQRAPRGRTGDLQASIGTEVRSDGLEVRVGSGAFYAKFVELGTVNASAKPFLFPAYKKGARVLRKRVRGLATDIGRRSRFKGRANSSARLADLFARGSQ